MNIGLITNLPDAQDRYLKNTNGSDAINAIGGANSFVLTQTNLPSVNFTGTTNTTGAHTHNYLDNPTTANNVVAGTNNPLANNSSINTQTSLAGNHSHTVTFYLGGSSTPVNLTPNYIITNVFIYLGN